MKTYSNQVVALALTLIGLALGVWYCSLPSTAEAQAAQGAQLVEGAHFKSVFDAPSGQLLDVIDAHATPVKVLGQTKSGWWQIEYTAADGKIVTGYVGFVDGLGEQR